MTRKNIIKITVIVLLIILSLVAIFIFKPLKGKDIVFVVIQRTSNNAEIEPVDECLFINRRGEYFVVPYDEVKQYGKNIMAAKAYFDKNKYEVEGKIFNTFEMLLLCKELENVDPRSDSVNMTMNPATVNQVKGTSISIYACDCVYDNLDELSDNQKLYGIDLYYSCFLKNNKVYEIKYLNDEHNKIVVNKVLMNLPRNYDATIINDNLVGTEIPIITN